MFNNEDPRIYTPTVSSSLDDLSDGIKAIKDLPLFDLYDKGSHIEIVRKSALDSLHELGLSVIKILNDEMLHRVPEIQSMSPIVIPDRSSKPMLAFQFDVSHKDIPKDGSTCYHLRVDNHGFLDIISFYHRNYHIGYFPKRREIVWNLFDSRGKVSKRPFWTFFDEVSEDHQKFLLKLGIPE
jgi:hypothetical protein